MAVTMKTKPKVKVAAPEVVGVVKAGGVAFPETTVKNLIARYTRFKRVRRWADKAETEYRPVEAEVRELVSASGIAPTAEIEFVYDQRTIKIGKQAKETKYTGKMETVFELLNGVQPGLAYSLMKFNLEDLRKYLTPDQLATFLTEADTGKRNVKVD